MPKEASNSPSLEANPVIAVWSIQTSTPERPNARQLSLLLAPVSQLLRRRAEPTSPRDRKPTVHHALAPPSRYSAEVSPVSSTKRVSMLSWFTPESVQLETYEANASAPRRT